jgi:hypothetical protein
MLVMAAPILAILFILSSTVPAFAAPALLQLSSDPYTVGPGQHATQVEPDTLSSGSTFVSTFQVGRIFGGGATNIGFATSTDGGKTFTHGFLPGTTTAATPPGIYKATSDASVAFDAKLGVWLISFLGLRPNGTSAVDVLVSRSTDGGLTWSNPIAVNNSGHFNDKNWSVCDNTSTSPFFGNCYTEFDDNTLGDRVQMSTSTNGGTNWSPAQMTGNKAFGIGGQPLVQPDGTVIVPINGFTRHNFTVAAFVSKNGGASWGPTHRIAVVDFRAPAGGIRSDIPLPSAEIDASGKVYVVWSDCAFEPGCSASDLVFSTSTNGNVWSKETRIPLDPVGSGVDHFLPGLAVDRSTSGSSAHLAVTFYYYPQANCTTATCQLDVGFSTSSDGGATWTANSQLAGPMALTWLPNTSQGFMVADYISTSFVGSPAFPAFAVASAPTSGGAVCQTATPNCDQAIFTVSGGLSVAGSAQPATDQTNTSSSDPDTSSSITVQ